MATLVRIDGTTVNVVPVNGKAFLLEEIQTAVGGYYEMHRMSGNRYMLMNEEGLMMDFPKNITASKILSDDWKTPVSVFGHVMIVSSKEMD